MPSSEMTSSCVAAVHWFGRLLTAKQFPPIESTPEEDRFFAEAMSDWCSPFELFYVAGNMRAANGGMPFELSSVTLGGDVLRFQDATGHAREVRFEMDGRRLRRVHVDLDLADGLCMRDARPGDFDVLETLEGEAAIPFGDGVCRIERNGSLATAIELLGAGRLSVVESRDEIVAFGGAASIPLTVGGIDGEFNYTHHYRVRDAARGRGLVRALSDASESPLCGAIAGVVAVVHEGNRRGVSSRAFPWQAVGQRVILDCAAIAGDPIGRAAREDDADMLCDRINHAHEGQEWFRRYTPDRLLERLARAPGAYGWPQLRVTDHAVVGTWHSGERRRYEGGDRAWSEVRGTILDYGFEPGHAEALERSLRACASESLKQGLTHLSLFTSERAPAWSVLERLAARVETYHVSCTAPEPDGAPERGVYIDPILA